MARTKITLSICWSLIILLSSFYVQAEEERENQVEIIKTTTLAAQGEPKYSADFAHFDYVNPDAPKGGELVQAALGTYDSFNRYGSRGDTVIGGLSPYQNFLYDTLMRGSSDEQEVLYPLIAESVEYPSDYAWVIFNLNPKARFHDGSPIRAQDVVFSFNKFFQEGVVQYRKHYEHVAKVEALSDQRVKYTFTEPNRDYIFGLAGSVIFPEHFWKNHNLSEPLQEPPLGSGPYAIDTYSLGKSVTYKRVEDYWAADLPVNKGRFNFDRIRFDYYLDRSVMLEAFKSGQVDIYQEAEASKWMEAYNIPAVTRGDIVKVELPNGAPPTVRALIYNLRQELFQDRRVREALNYMLDFEWLNKTLFYDQYSRIHSYFGKTPYQAEGKPEGQELAVLKPFAEQLPEEVFGEIWRPNTTDASGSMRPQMRRALALLKEAGWELQKGVLTHKETGKPFSFELLTYVPTTERYALPFKRNLERIGIDMSIRLVDSTQYLNRLHNKDFDMVSLYFQEMLYPSSSMSILWHSDHVDASWNLASVQDPIIDALVEGIAASQEDDVMLKAYGQAFDRVALWNFYMIPLWYYDYYRVAHWNSFSHPEVMPKLDLGLDTWWFDANKASKQ